jgi:hypothetical protein
METEYFYIFFYNGSFFRNKMNWSLFSYTNKQKWVRGFFEK